MKIETINEHRASPFSRSCLVAYLVLIVYASWYPFSGWQINNLAAISDVVKQWPRYWSIFDVAMNIVGYIPLGLLIVFALYPRFLRAWAIVFATVLGILISMSMEGVQYFLPHRVTSILDLITNASHHERREYRVLLLIALQFQNIAGQRCPQD